MQFDPPIEPQMLAITCCAQGWLKHANRAASSLLGFDPTVMLGTHILEWMHPDEVATNAYSAGQGLPFAVHGMESVRRLRHADGDWRFFSLLAHPCVLDGGGPAVLLTGRDVSSLKLAHATIERMALHETVTGLANRRLLLDRLQQVMVTSERSRKLAALLFLNLEYARSGADGHWHDSNEEVMLSVAQRLKSCVRAADTVACLSDEKFVLLLQDLGEDVTQATAQARKLGHKVLTSLGVPELRGLASNSGARIGAVVIDDPATAAESWLRKADQAMRQAKAGARSSLRFFSASAL